MVTTVILHVAVHFSDSYLLLAGFSENMVRGLDDDEVEFLDTVERLKENLDKKVREEERAEMEQFRSAVATLAEQNMVQRLQKEIEPAKVAPPKKAAS